MDILDRLIQNATTTKNLTAFLTKNSNSVELSDFFVSQSHQSLLQSKERVENFILPYFEIYQHLDFSRPNNVSFISFLIEFSERFGLLTEFERLFQLHTEKQLEVSSRLKATSLYLIGITNIRNYSDQIQNILELLKCAYYEEEDDQDIIVSTFLNFFAQVVHNFASQNRDGVTQFRTTLNQFITQDDYSFLDSELVNESLNISIEDNVSAYQAIQKLLDEYLSRTQKYLPFNVHTLISEKGTDYVNSVNKTRKSFSALQQLCSSLYQGIENTGAFYSLQRGVAILTEPNQLLAYMHSYGKMHNAKILSALDEAKFPNELFDNELEIYDWGCGQGLASFIFHEKYPTAHSNTILIEPSEIALKRAAMHIETIAPTTDITTINKDLDSLLDIDLGSHPERVKIHLFSNVLDIESFSMIQLLELMKGHFYGVNYFICVSPRVNQRKTNRLNNFMEFFKGEVGFEEYVNLDSPKGQWTNNWTRSIRVFKAGKPLHK